MSKSEPTVAEIEAEVVELLRTEELSSLATIDADGFPSSAGADRVSAKLSRIAQWRA
ncbi:hypothetical protein [Streptomyces violaceusniger]|uniref:Uncharacterized protein n=1 Tax=Streptomyces violaceusniger TaxID=68280 RepID=A0A4D4KP25_STRVO|nr:hypothetical protein SVIO_005270 [Streptomyces violaceusniger]